MHALLKKSIQQDAGNFPQRHGSSHHKMTVVIKEWSAAVLRLWCLNIDTKGSKVCQENIPTRITPPAAI